MFKCFGLQSSFWPKIKIYEHFLLVFGLSEEFLLGDFNFLGGLSQVVRVLSSSALVQSEGNPRDQEWHVPFKLWVSHLDIAVPIMFIGLIIETRAVV